MKKKTNAFNLGAKGWIIVLLAFVSCYVYSALTSDSLNVTIGVFGEMGLNTDDLKLLTALIVAIALTVPVIIDKKKRLTMYKKLTGKEFENHA